MVGHPMESPLPAPTHPPTCQGRAISWRLGVVFKIRFCDICPYTEEETYWGIDDDRLGSLEGCVWRIYTGTHIYIPKYISLPTYLPISRPMYPTYLYIPTHPPTLPPSILYKHTYIHTYIHTYTYIHTHIHTYIHTYIHIYIHTCIHT